VASNQIKQNFSVKKVMLISIALQIYFILIKIPAMSRRMVNVISPCTACSWISIFVDPGSTFRFTVYVKFRLRIGVKHLNISVIDLSLPSGFREKLWVG